jgi:DNA topoisomerase VI subunit B
VREVARRLSVFLSRKHTFEREKKRLDVFEKYLPKIALFSTKLAKEKKEPNVKPLLKNVLKYEEKEDTGETGKEERTG